MSFQKNPETMGTWLKLALWICLGSSRYNTQLNPPRAPPPDLHPALCKASLLGLSLCHVTLLANGSANANYGVNITGQSLPGAPPWIQPWAHTLHL